MAKSSIELIRELTTDVRILETGNVLFRAQLADLKSADQKQQAEIADLRKENADLRRELADTSKETVKEISVLKQQVQDHLAHYQEWDKRRWALILALLGTVLSLAVGLILAFVRK